MATSYPLTIDESVMSPKANGTSEEPTQKGLRWKVDQELASRICLYNRHNAEHSGYFEQQSEYLQEMQKEGQELTYYDSVTGKPLFIAPRGRTAQEFLSESLDHGWPSFRDEEVVWDDVRCLANGETVSLNGTHLGHNLPDEKGNRYCINLVSVAGAPMTNTNTNTNTNPNPVERACFGAGCYWGTENYFKKLNGSIIKEGKVGFMGPEGSIANPTYQQVCSGISGHVEVYDCSFSGGAQAYEDLVRTFFRFHDPTTANMQGGDVGTQYASVIYCYSAQHLVIASRVKAELQALLHAGAVTSYDRSTVETDIRPCTLFYPAHKEHQEYLLNNPNGYCNHRVRMNWPEKGRTPTVFTKL